MFAPLFPLTFINDLTLFCAKTVSMCQIGILVYSLIQKERGGLQNNGFLFPPPIAVNNSASDFTVSLQKLYKCAFFEPFLFQIQIN